MGWQQADLRSVGVCVLTSTGSHMQLHTANNTATDTCTATDSLGREESAKGQA